LHLVGILFPQNKEIFTIEKDVCAWCVCVCVCVWCVCVCVCTYDTYGNEKEQ